MTIFGGMPVIVDHWLDSKRVKRSLWERLFSLDWRTKYKTVLSDEPKFFLSKDRLITNPVGYKLLTELQQEARNG